MRSARMTLLALATVAILAACGEATPEPSEPTANATEGAAASPTPPPASADLSDPCTLVAEAEIAKILGSAPMPKSKSYGAGFSECVWEGDGKSTVRLSVIPAADLAKDYINKLNKTGLAPALGEDGTLFPGVVGIGHASSGGASVGFTAGGHGILLAVRTGTDVSKDEATAMMLGADIRKRL